MPGRSAKGYVEPNKLCGVYLAGSPQFGIAKVGFSSDVVGRIRDLRKSLRKKGQMAYMGMSDQDMRHLASTLKLIAFTDFKSTSPMDEESCRINLLSLRFPNCGRSAEWFITGQVPLSEVARVANLNVIAGV